MSVEAILAALSAAAASPIVQGIALLLLGWALKVGKDAAVIILRSRGAKVEQDAQSQVDKAKETKDENDDKVALANLQRAHAQKEVLDALAAAIAAQDPTALVQVLAKGGHQLPPDVANLLRGKP